MSPDARILLKPNLNSYMSALTGNTTDLRIISAVIQFLKDHGYKDITIGEGSNSGFYRNKIGVISRLAIDRLGKYYDVKVKDLNYAVPAPVTFSNGVEAMVAKDCVDADLFINLPKLKTHFEMDMSVCLKNMMGCLVGQENKKKTHLALAENILWLNQGLKPHLHIVDALVAMEGLGPTRGTPVRMDTLLVGTDPYLIDLACARLAGFKPAEVRGLRLAEKKGFITKAYHEYVNSLDVGDIERKFAPPEAGPLASFIHSPKRQKFFLKIRNTKLFTYLASTGWFGHLLFLTGLRQDVFVMEDMVCEGLSHDKEACSGCRRCGMVCPLGNAWPDDAGSEQRDCINCLYCYSVCPRRAIKFQGKHGFFAEQMKQYDEMIKQIYEDNNEGMGS